MLQLVKYMYITPHLFEKQRFEIKAVKVVLELFKLTKQTCNVRTVEYLQILIFVRVILAHYGVIYVTFSATPY